MAMAWVVDMGRDFSRAGGSLTLFKNLLTIELLNERRGAFFALHW